MYDEQFKSLKVGARKTFNEIQKFYKGNLIIDVGSNVGAFISCVLDVFPNASILAFEPVKKYYDYSRLRFKQPNVHIENKALSDVTELNEIFIAKNNIGWNTLIKEKTDDDNGQTTELIKCIKFDDYYDNQQKVDIIKIDTEGYEYKVLNGMFEFLKSQKPVIICEVGWGQSHPHWLSELITFEYLYSIGYSDYNRNQILNLNSTQDVIFIPKDI